MNSGQNLTVCGIIWPYIASFPGAQPLVELQAKIGKDYHGD
jgi:hypothetical protein